MDAAVDVSLPSDGGPSVWPSAIEAVLSGASQPAIHLQPIVDLHNGSIAGYEALARFPAPPIAGPDRWFLAAARLGLAAELEGEVLTRAFTHLPALPANAFLSVNVSPEFLASPGWHRLVSAHARLDRLVIELSEHSAIERFRLAQSAIKVARQRGAMLAVDDTGSGYASLQHVMRLRPEFVKLDSALITSCDSDYARASAIETVAHVASHIDAWVIAEGVESEAELRCLIRLGVPLAQGWLPGRPLPEWGGVPEQARAVIADHRKRAADLADAADLLDAWPHLADRDDPPTLPTKLTLVLDAEQRPVSWTGPGAPRCSRPLLVRRHTPLRALARRAMARSEASRFLPIVCTDHGGRYLGVIRIEQLVSWLASR